MLGQLRPILRIQFNRQIHRPGADLPTNSHHYSALN
jgi:hypothetical protein